MIIERRELSLEAARKFVFKHQRNVQKVCLLSVVLCLYFGLSWMSTTERLLNRLSQVVRAISVSGEEKNVSNGAISLRFETNHKRNTLVNMYDSTRDKMDNLSVKISQKTVKILWYTVPNYLSLPPMNENFAKYCTYSNCIMTENRDELHRADAIIFPLYNPLDASPPIPKHERNPSQIWIFFYSEAPNNHAYHEYEGPDWMSTMNWSMSYELNADIFAPYGSLVRRKMIPDEDDHYYESVFKRKTKFIAWIVSNCNTRSQRNLYVEQMAENGVDVDVYGKCGNGTSISEIEINALLDKEYLFYLSFENSFCKDYVTEKFFNYFKRDVVLVVRGGLDYNKELPNDTFINAANFQSPKELAIYLMTVGSSAKLYSRYLKAKSMYESIYSKDLIFYPVSYCTMCENLNNLENHRKTYADHAAFIHTDKCWNATDLFIH